MRGEDLVRIFLLEAVPALTTTELHFINVKLFYRKHFAGFGPACAVHAAQAVFGQHWAGEQQVAAGSALAAGSFAGSQLFAYVMFSKMNHPETFQFAPGIHHETGFMKGLRAPGGPTI